MAPEQTGNKEEGNSPTLEATTTPTPQGDITADPANLSTVSVDSTNGEHDPYYEPVITLPEVTIKTNEEDEEVLYKERCKLFRYVGETSEWKERGTGNVKLLKNEKKGTVRLLMRQEKTLKVRANHYLTPYTKLKDSAGSERAFVWYVMLDFADEEAKSETFAIRFANCEIARTFKKAMEEAVYFVTMTTAGLESSDEEDLDEDEEKENKEQVSENTESEQEKPKETSPSVKDVTDSLGKLEVEEKVTTAATSTEQTTETS